MIAAAVLAAGRGSRMGGAGSKVLEEVGGRALVLRALDAAFESGCRPVLLVVGWRGDEVGAAARGAFDPAPAVVVNPAWSEGIATSLRAALDDLEARAEVDAVCMGLGDQPGVGAGAYERLAAAHAAGAALAVATYGGERGNPVLLGRTLWPEARLLGGDVGARVLMDAHEVVEVPCDGTGDPGDVDSAADLAAWRSAIHHRAGPSS